MCCLASVRLSEQSGVPFGSSTNIVVGNLILVTYSEVLTLQFSYYILMLRNLLACLIVGLLSR